MALLHALSGELIDIRPFKSSFKDAITKTLYKSNPLKFFEWLFRQKMRCLNTKLLVKLPSIVLREVLSLLLQERTNLCMLGI